MKSIPYLFALTQNFSVQNKLILSIYHIFKLYYVTDKALNIFYYFFSSQ